MALQVVGMLSPTQSCQNTAVVDGQQLLVISEDTDFDDTLVDFGVKF
jgi:hypothetical protein